MCDDDKKQKDWVVGFLKDAYQLDAAIIAECSKQSSDLEVYKDEQRLFYCEIKSLFENKAGMVFSELRVEHDSAFNKISKHIISASKQFSSINPCHDTPNVLFFLCYDEMLSSNDLCETLTGCFAGLPTCKQVSEGRLKNKIETIDLILWVQMIDDEKHPRPKFFFNKESKFFKVLNSFFNPNEESLASID